MTTKQYATVVPAHTPAAAGAPLAAGAFQNKEKTAWTNIVLITITTVITIILTITCGQSWALLLTSAVHGGVTRGMYIYAFSITAATLLLCVTFALLAAELDVRRYMQKRNPLIGTQLVPVFKDDEKTIKGYIVAGQDYQADDTKPFNPVVDASAYILSQ